MGFSAKIPKVLHCVERMHTNAIESWLARMYRHSLLRGRAVNWRFHVQFNEPGLLETTYPECTPLIIRSPCQISEWGRFFLAFRHTCRTERFDVVHVHADLMSAPYAVAARSAGVRRIVVHVHNADESVLTPNRKHVESGTEPMSKDNGTRDIRFVRTHLLHLISTIQEAH